MARSHGHGHGGHGHGSFSQERLDEVKDDIVRLKRRIRQERAAGNNVDVLENNLGDLEIKQREYERNDPVAQGKRRVTILENEAKIHHLEEEAKKHHKKHWLIRLGFGGWVAILFVSYFLFAGLFKNMFPAAVEEFAGWLAVIVVLYGITKFIQLKKGSSAGGKDSKQSTAAAHH